MAELTEFTSGGGGGVMLNSVAPFNETATLFERDRQTFLRTGYTSSDPADLTAYPDATRHIDAFDVVTTINYQSPMTANDTKGMVWDGSHWWLLLWGSKDEDGIYKHNADGTYAGVYIDVSDHVSRPFSIAWDGAHLWIGDYSSGEVYQYTTNGVHTGAKWSAAGELGSDNMFATLWDGSNFWAAGKDGAVRQYSSAGGYTGVGFSANVLSGDNSVLDMTFDGVNLWFCGYSGGTKLVYSYSKDGNFLSQFQTANQPLGVEFLNGNLKTLEYTGLNTYGDTIGVRTEMFESVNGNQSGFPLYTRIK